MKENKESRTGQGTKAGNAKSEKSSTQKSEPKKSKPKGQRFKENFFVCEWM